MSLNEVWEGAAGSPFYPAVSKERQFLVAFSLLLVGILLTSFFGLIFGATTDWLGSLVSAIQLEGSKASSNSPYSYLKGIATSPRFTASGEGAKLPDSKKTDQHYWCLRLLGAYCAVMVGIEDTQRPLFAAVSSSARQLFLLLRCISFAPKVHVQITRQGLRFMAEESQVMQGLVFLEKSLFTTYTYTHPTHVNGDEGDDDESQDPVFQISLSSLLETLQIFGINDIKDRWASRDQQYGSNGTFTRAGSAAAFENRVLGMTGVCSFGYAAEGEPFCITLEETGVTTRCELVTYEPEDREDIPLQRDNLSQKIIMRASWLHDAINELASTSPSRLTIAASPTAPYFTLSSSGALGSATVEFSNDPQLLETFQVPSRTVNTYKFALVKNASKAMAIASKVSIRGDVQGVLSLQFMIEVEGGGVSFVDFRYVPYVPEDDEGDEDGEAVGDEGVQ